MQLPKPILGFALSGLSLGLIAPGSLGANLAVNGDFELPGGAFVLLEPGSTHLPGWTPFGGTVAYRGDGDFDDPLAPEAGNCVALGYWVAGGIEQALPTDPGKVHTVSLYVAADPLNGTNAAQLVATGHTNSQIFNTGIPTGDTNNVGWQYRRFAFRSSPEGPSVLRFQNLGTNAAFFGVPLIDGVQVQPGLPVALVGTEDQSSPVFRQTGLFEQTVRVTNPGPITLQAVRLRIENVPAGISVHNASGSEAGVPYVQLARPLQPGASVNLRLEFYDPNRRALPGVNYVALEGPAVEPVEPEGQNLSIDRALRYPDGRFLVEFSSLAGRRYWIQYRDDIANSPWRTAVPALTGNGTQIQWLDAGPPKTDSPPDSAVSRFYRLVLEP